MCDNLCVVTRRKNTEPGVAGRISREEYKTRSKSVDASVYFQDGDKSSSYFDDLSSTISRSRPSSVKYSVSHEENPYRKYSGSTYNAASSSFASEGKYSAHSTSRAASQEAPRSRASSVVRDSEPPRRRKSSVWGEAPEVGVVTSASRASSVVPDLEDAEAEVVETMTKRPVRNR